MFRKSQAGSTITLIASTILIFFILLVFLSLASLFPFSKINEGEVIKYSEKQQEFVSLQAYLNTSVKMNIENSEQEFAIKDIIRLWASGNNEYRNILEIESKEIFDKLSHGNPCYYLKIDNEEANQGSANSKKENSILETGNSKLASKEGFILELPLASYKKSDIKIVIDSKCIEK